MGSRQNSQALTIIHCAECRWKDTNGCPAFDAPMRRTSLRIDFCSAGEEKKQDKAPHQESDKHFNIDHT